MALLDEGDRLRKELSLADVFAVSAGAMFSSGFFLLPGLAASQSGPSVVLAYALAALLVLPALFSKAELSTAMPRAGGTYFFLDRSMGPMVGTIGGIGIWLTLILKTAFALVGMGAYLAVFVGWRIETVALSFAAVLMLVNILGARETTRIQRFLVAGLLLVLGAFIVDGLVHVGSRGFGRTIREQFTPFAPFGLEGTISTVGLVFVSFVGLTKVASIPEEVRDPDRNVPLGMLLSLGVATLVYIVGISLMVAVLEPESLHHDLTPVATAAAEIFAWLPGRTGVYALSAAALVAFAAMANAGVMSASRYPLAMARDNVIPPWFSSLGRFRTPARSIVLTVGLIAVFLLTLDVMSVAKLASALQLLVFSLVNLAVIVMRESRLEAYDPGFESPLYPWMQVAGILVPLWLIVEIGVLPIVFTLGVVLGATAWYRHYTRPRVERGGAMFHVFERLGRRRSGGLDRELRQILKEKGLRETDPFDSLVADAPVLELEGELSFREVIERAARRAAGPLAADADQVVESVMKGTRVGATPVSHGTALPHARVGGLEGPRLIVARDRKGIVVPDAGDDRAASPRGPGSDGAGAKGERVYAIFFLASPKDRPGQHLRILAQLASRVDEDGFLRRWRAAGDEEGLKRILLGSPEP